MACIGACRAGTALLAIILVLAPAKPAEAGLDACFKAVAAWNEVGEAAQIAAKVAACAGVATGDPVMVLTIAGLTAAAAAKEFSTSGECKAKIDGSVGRLVAEALAELPFLGTQQKTLLLEFARGNLPVSFNDILIMTGLGIVAAYIECGCSVAGAAGDLAEIAEQYTQSLTDCANFVADAIGSVMGAVGDVFEDWFAPTGTGEMTAATTCPGVYVFPPDLWTERNLQHRREIATECGQLICEEGLVVVERTTSAGVKQYKCATSCPEAAKGFAGQCYWRDLYATGTGRCVLGQQAEATCCGDGQRVFEWGKCSPACLQGAAYWNRKANSCERCPAGTHPIYESSDSSVGACVQCPFGHVYSRETLRCQCPPGQHTVRVSERLPSAGKRGGGSKGQPGVLTTVPETTLTYCEPDAGCEPNEIRSKSGKCTPCARGRVARAGQCVLITELPALLEAAPQRIREDCPLGQKREGERCVYPSCPPGQIRKGRTCSLPPCPKGQVRIGPACVLPPCPQGQIRVGARCAFPPCPPGQVRKGANCVQTIKPAPIKPAPQLKVKPGQIVCPPGLKPGPRGCAPSVR